MALLCFDVTVMNYLPVVGRMISFGMIERDLRLIKILAVPLIHPSHPISHIIMKLVSL